MKSVSQWRTSFWTGAALLGFFAASCVPCVGQSNLSASAGAAGKAKILLDTDIGDDVDDAFALGLALQSPEVEIVGVTTAWGDTSLRARMARRMLLENGRGEIPVAEGIVTTSKTKFSQAEWAEKGPPTEAKTDAVEFLL